MQADAEVAIAAGTLEEDWMNKKLTEFKHYIAYQANYSILKDAW